MFAEGQPPFATPMRRLSEVSLQSTVSGVIDSLPLQTINARKYYHVHQPTQSQLHINIYIYIYMFIEVSADRFYVIRDFSGISAWV